jgi:predicted membrane-bound dolichyl-phosphate-mannose-protein mannosyltransferase
MNRGEFLTRLPVWLALGGYGLGAAIYILSRGRRKWDARARLAWTTGCLAMLLHVAFAFHFYYHWRHDLSLSETARQTSEVFGWYWGGGLYINSAFIAAWVVDVSWWWRGLARYRRRSRLVTAAWHGFMLFMFFNATVIFKTGILRWLGLFLCAGLGLLWLVSSKTKNAPDSTQVSLQEAGTSKL